MFRRVAGEQQINGSAVLVDEVLEADPFSHAVYLFCNRERRILKAVYRDRIRRAVAVEYRHRRA